jgi:hypothetical protein
MQILCKNYPMVVRPLPEPIKSCAELGLTDRKKVLTVGNEGLTPAWEPGMDEGTTGTDGKRKTAGPESLKQWHPGDDDDAAEPEKARKEAGLADGQHHTHS